MTIRTLLDVEAPGGRSQKEIRAAWHEFAHSLRFAGFANRDYLRDFEESGLTTSAYVNDSRWVADCPTENCNGAMMTLPGHPEAACFDCGFIHTITFPPDREIQDATQVLLLRPKQSTRNWVPGEESVQDLKTDNAVHGVAFTK